jgi:hypothetical protein
LKAVEDDLPLDEKQRAEYVLERIADLRAFFQFAQMALETLVASKSDIDFDEISRIEIG